MINAKNVHKANETINAIENQLRGLGPQKNYSTKNSWNPFCTPNEIKMKIIPRLNQVASFAGNRKKTGMKKSEMKKHKMPIAKSKTKHL